MATKWRSEFGFRGQYLSQTNVKKPRRQNSLPNYLLFDFLSDNYAFFVTLYTPYHSPSCHVYPMRGKGEQNGV